MSAEEIVVFVVGGVHYPVLREDIIKFPGSFFEAAIKNEQWDGRAPIEVSRDEKLFRLISAFITIRALPREQGRLDLSTQTIAALREEAIFFNLPTLEVECSALERRADPDMELKYYKIVHNYINSMEVSREVVCAFPTNQHSVTDLMILLGNIGSPFCVKGVFPFRDSGSGMELYKSSTIDRINIPELLEIAAECTTDASEPSARMSHEISVAQLNDRTVNLLPAYADFRSIASNLQLNLRANKLYISQAGDHLPVYLRGDSTEGKGHIGTLVLILNSKYTGGELEITHNGQTEVVTGPYSWVAMYGDCLHKINPVTSGTRVSIVYSIYADRTGVGSYGLWEGRVPVVHDRMHAVSPRNRALILEGIEKELGLFDALIICLAHRYPLTSAHVGLLKGGDRMLYDLLKDEYDVQMVTSSIVTSQSSLSGERDVEAGVFTSFASAPATEEEGDKSPPAGKRAKRGPRTKLLLPFPMDADCVLECSSERRDREGKYLVSGLRLRKRA